MPQTGPQDCRVGTSKSQESGAKIHAGSGRNQSDWTIIAGLLNDRTDAIETVREWASGVARHRAWGFETAEDVVQEVLLVLVRNLREGRYATGNLRGYVRRVAKNICISNYRRTRSRGVQVSLENDAPIVAQQNRSSDVENRAMVGRILEAIAEECRRVIWMAYLEGFSRREIASALGISESAAKVRLHRCIEMARSVADGEMRRR